MECRRNETGPNHVFLRAETVPWEIRFLPQEGSAFVT